MPTLRETMQNNSTGLCSSIRVHHTILVKMGIAFKVMAFVLHALCLATAPCHDEQVFQNW